MINATDPASVRIDTELREHFGSEVSRLERAAESFEAGKARLYRPDGQPVYGPEEHQQRIDALLAQFDAVGSAVAEEAEAAIATAEADLVGHLPCW